MDENQILRHRYLSLLESALTGILFGDAPIDRWSGPNYDENRRMIGRDWPSHAHTMIGSVRLRSLRQMCETVLLDGIDGDFIETGVWRGGACILMKGVLSAHGDDKRRVFLADSFEGLPKPVLSQDAGDLHHTYEQLAVSRSQVESNFRKYGLLDERVIFLEGWFRDTLPTAPIERLAILRLDGDMYESTMQALEALYPKLSSGGFVIIDDYFLAPCANAVNDYRKRMAIETPILPIDGAGTWWRKQ
jgi:O-methyltransferase